MDSHINRVTNIMVGILVFFVLIYIARSILIPIVTAAVLSFAIYPIIRRFQSWRMPLLVATVLTLLIVVCFVGLCLFLIGAQLSAFAQDIPNLSQKFNNVLIFIQDYIEDKWRIKSEKQLSLLTDSLSQIFSTSADVLATTISTTSNILFYLGMVPIYMIFMIYYHELFGNFIIDLADTPQKKQLWAGIIGKVQPVIQRYIGGLAIVIIIVGLLNTIGFSLLGIPYAIFFGSLISLLAIIPYFGILAASLLAVVYTFLTTDSIWYPVGVIGITGFVQFLEGNFITPSIMGAQIQLNPLMLMIGLLLGSFLWGPMGMILTVPIMAITKMICDNIDGLRPFGRVLGTGNGDAASSNIEPQIPIEAEAEDNNAVEQQTT